MPIDELSLTPLVEPKKPKTNHVWTVTIKLPPTASGTTAILAPDVLIALCHHFSPRQLQLLVRTCKDVNRVLLRENEGYWTWVAAHILFRGDFIMELPRIHGTRPFPGFALQMPDLIPQHNLFHMLGMDISRGQAYQLFTERLHMAIELNAGEAPRFPGWMEYVGLSTRDAVLKKFDELVDEEQLQELRDQGAVGDVRRFDVSMREIAMVTIDQTRFSHPRVRAMHAFAHELEDDQEFTPAMKRKFMRKLFSLQNRIDSLPGRTFSARELITKICRF